MTNTRPCCPTCKRALPLAGRFGPRQARKGANHPNAKITYDTAVQIRLEFDAGASMRSLAKKFGVAHTTIRAIVNGVTWVSTTRERIMAARTPEQRAKDPSLAIRTLEMPDTMPKGPLAMDPLAYASSPEMLRRVAEGYAFNPDDPFSPPLRRLTEEDLYIVEDIADEVCTQEEYDHRMLWWTRQQALTATDNPNTMNPLTRKSPLL